ncbi:hypothetical protein [Roseivivax sp. CAU 1761]
MIHTAALFASIASFGLICAIYFCNFMAPRGSWLRTEMLASILLSLLTGLFPLALAASLVGLWTALTGGVSLGAILSAGTDLVSIATVIATGLVFRRAVKATYGRPVEPDNVAPFPAPPAGAAGPRLSGQRAA